MSLHTKVLTHLIICQCVKEWAQKENLERTQITHLRQSYMSEVQ